MNTEYRPRQGGNRRGGRRHRRTGGDYAPQDSQAASSSRHDSKESHSSYERVDRSEFKKKKPQTQGVISRFISWVKRIAGFKAPAAGSSAATGKGGKDAVKPYTNGNVFTKEEIRAKRGNRPERTERAERPERVEREETDERPERAERVERSERPERGERDRDRDRSERAPRRGGRNQPRPVEEADFTPESAPARSSVVEHKHADDVDADIETDSDVETEQDHDDNPDQDVTPSSSKQQRLEITNTKLFVGNLSYDAAESDIFDLFSKVGKVKNVEVVKDRNNKSKGFAFVEMEHMDSAKAAAEQIDQTQFMGRSIRISGAKSDRH